MLEEERTLALQIQECFPPDVPYFIPVRLEPCDIPSNLQAFQWIDFFATDGFERLCAAIEMSMQQRLPTTRGTARGQQADDHSIVIQGTLVLPIYPLMGISVAARLYAGNRETFVHPNKGEELEAMWRMKLPVNERTTFYEGAHHGMYDLGFVFPGGHFFESKNGFVMPTSWPFTTEDVHLGSDIISQLSLAFRSDATLTVRRQKR